ITAERHVKKSGLAFRYYRCTKKGTPCGQKYISEIKLAEQVDTILAKVALSPDWTHNMLAQAKAWENENSASSALAVADWQTELLAVESRLSKLLDAHLDGLIEPYEYQAKKLALLGTKTTLKDKIGRRHRQSQQWLELFKNWVNEASQAHNIWREGSFAEKASLLKKIGSNRLLGAGKASAVWENSWKILAEIPENSEWLGDRDSNPD
ncbi:MAG: hypothetical protein Q8L21_03285, partial [Candidatus Komeilibacteria bacterium]|nr:hypothetical protein [Candidatus Komeilibacteria bacterium]